MDYRCYLLASSSIFSLSVERNNNHNFLKQYYFFWCSSILYSSYLFSIKWAFASEGERKTNRQLFVEVVMTERGPMFTHLGNERLL